MQSHQDEDMHQPRALESGSGEGKGQGMALTGHGTQHHPIESLREQLEGL